MEQGDFRRPSLAPRVVMIPLNAGYLLNQQASERKARLAAITFHSTLNSCSAYVLPYPAYRISAVKLNAGSVRLVSTKRSI